MNSHQNGPGQARMTKATIMRRRLIDWLNEKPSPLVGALVLAFTAKLT